MRKLLAASLVFASLGIGITSMALAQDARPVPPSDHGMTGGDMSGMMSCMNKMMDTCEKMMQSSDRQNLQEQRG